jgi:hypothetical protein
VIALGAVGVLMLLFGSAELRAVTSPFTAGSVIDRDVAEPVPPAAAPATRVKLAGSKQSRHRFTALLMGAAAAAVVLLGAGGIVSLTSAGRRRQVLPAAWRPRGPPTPVSL